MLLEPTLSPDDVAALSGMSYDGVLRDIRSGKLKATRKGKGYRVKREWYDEWLEADVVQPLPARRRSPVRRAPTGTPEVGSVADLRRIQREAAA